MMCLPAQVQLRDGICWPCLSWSLYPGGYGMNHVARHLFKTLAIQVYHLVFPVNHFAFAVVRVRIFCKQRCFTHLLV